MLVRDGFLRSPSQTKTLILLYLSTVAWNILKFLNHHRNLGLGSFPRFVLFVWMTAGAFGLGTWVVKGKTSALEFFAGYIVEQSLSVDNLFIFIMLFDYFKVPAEFQVGLGSSCGERESIGESIDCSCFSEVENLSVVVIPRRFRRRFRMTICSAP